MNDTADQQLIQRLLADPNRVEVLSWLQSPGPQQERVLGEMTPQESITFAEDIYRQGAIKVLAVDVRITVREYIDETVTVQSTGKLIITLPADRVARKEIMRWQATLARSLGFDGAVDTGQEHVFVLLD